MREVKEEAGRGTKLSARVEFSPLGLSLLRFIKTHQINLRYLPSRDISTWTEVVVCQPDIAIPGPWPENVWRISLTEWKMITCKICNSSVNNFHEGNCSTCWRRGTKNMHLSSAVFLLYWELMEIPTLVLLCKQKCFHDDSWGLTPGEGAWSVPEHNRPLETLPAGLRSHVCLAFHA